MSKDLLKMYQDIADITNPLCISGNGCGELAKNKYHCCERKYCDMAAKFAKDNYGIELKPTGNDIPFMGENGCTVELHLRPICTIHACSISWAAKSIINNSNKQTQEYFDLRQRILDEENAAGRKIY